MSTSKMGKGKTRVERRFTLIRIAILVLIVQISIMAGLTSCRVGTQQGMTPKEKESTSQVLGVKTPLSQQILETSNLTITSNETTSRAVKVGASSIWPPNWAGFLPSIIATFIGVLLGFFSAFLLNRLVEERAQTKEDRQRRERHILVLQLLGDEIIRNEDRLNQMKSELRASLVLDYSVMLDVWQATKKEVLEAIRGSEAAEAITQLYNYLDLIAGALAVYNRLTLAGGGDLAMARTERLPRLEKLIDQATDAATRATQAVSSEVQRLKAEK